MASLALPGNAATLTGKTAPSRTILLPPHALPLPISRPGLRERVPQRRNNPTATHSPAAGHRQLHPATPGSRRNAAHQAAPTSGAAGEAAPGPPSCPGGVRVGCRSPGPISLPVASPGACDTLAWRQDQGVPRAGCCRRCEPAGRAGCKTPAAPPHTAARRLQTRGHGAPPLPRPSRGCRWLTRRPPATPWGFFFSHTLPPRRFASWFFEKYRIKTFFSPPTGGYRYLGGPGAGEGGRGSRWHDGGRGQRGRARGRWGKVGTVRAGAITNNKGRRRHRRARDGERGGGRTNCKLYLPSAREERRARCRSSPPRWVTRVRHRSEGLDYEHDFIDDSHSLLFLNSCPSSGPLPTPPLTDATAQEAAFPLARRRGSARPPARKGRSYWRRLTVTQPRGWGGEEVCRSVAGGECCVSMRARPPRARLVCPPCNGGAASAAARGSSAPLHPSPAHVCWGEGGTGAPSVRWRRRQQQGAGSGGGTRGSSLGRGEEGAGTPPCRCPCLLGRACRCWRGWGEKNQPDGRWGHLYLALGGGGSGVPLPLGEKKKGGGRYGKALLFGPRAWSWMAEDAVVDERRLPTTFQLNRPVRRAPSPNGRRRGGTAGAGGRLFTACPFGRPGCALSQVWRRLLKWSPDRIRLCEEQRWISCFLGIGRVNSTIMFVPSCLLPSLQLYNGLEVEFWTSRAGAVFFFFML